MKASAKDIATGVAVGYVAGFVLWVLPLALLDSEEPLSLLLLYVACPAAAVALVAITRRMLHR